MQFRKALWHAIEEDPHDLPHVATCTQQEIGVPGPAPRKPLLQEGDERLFLAWGVRTDLDVRLEAQDVVHLGQRRAAIQLAPHVPDLFDRGEAVMREEGERLGARRRDPRQEVMETALEQDPGRPLALQVRDRFCQETRAHSLALVVRMHRHQGKVARIGEALASRVGPAPKLGQDEADRLARANRHDQVLGPKARVTLGVSLPEGGHNGMAIAHGCLPDGQ
ncbi:hypothetical protein D3C86_1224270 [compost metagenome]